MKKCLRCAAQNGDEYGYCRLCGALLPEIEAKFTSSKFSEEKGDRTIADSPFELSVYEMEAFVGKNSDDIVKRFAFMQKTGRKASFCLPVFLLGLFFGLFGIAVWFLYRKMTKPAVFLFLGAFIMQAASAIVNFKFLYLAFVAALDIFGLPFGQTDFQTVINFAVQLCKGFFEANSVITLSRFSVNAAAIIIFAVFALAIYKKNCCKSVFSLKSKAADKADYTAALKNEGGVSVGRAVVGGLIYLAALSVIGLAFLIIIFIVGLL